MSDVHVAAPPSAAAAYTNHRVNANDPYSTFYGLHPQQNAQIIPGIDLGIPPFLPCVEPVQIRTGTNLRSRVRQKRRSEDCMIKAHHRQGGFVPPLGCSRRCKIKSVQTLLTTSTLRL
eukprot:6178305-Pleurochrysis_carterae.AAC.1